MSCISSSSERGHASATLGGRAPWSARTSSPSTTSPRRPTWRCWSLASPSSSSRFRRWPWSTSSNKRHRLSGGGSRPESSAREVLLHPVHAIILSTAGADIHRLLWPGADTPLVVDDAIRAVVGDQVIRCHAFLHPRDKRFERVSLVASGAVATMAHSGKHEQSNLLPRSVDIAPERCLDYLQVVVECRFRLPFRVGPSMKHEQLAVLAKQ